METYSRNFTQYHVHSYYSLLDSCTSPEEYIKRAAECGMKAFGWAEHGQIFNWHEKQKLCEQYGLKYLHGIEIYITEKHEEKVKDNWHTVLIAKNYEGFKEINNLFFKSSQPDHTYYKRRISVEEFLAISDNVIKISACIQSPLWQLRKLIMADEDEERKAKRKALYIAMAKHYDYYEIQYHNFPDNIEYTKLLYKMSKMFNKPLIAGTDTHSLNDYKAECRVILQYGKTENDWGNSENECDLTFKTYDELVEKFKEQSVLPEEEYLQAIENTNRMADSCEVLTFDKKDKYPYLYGEDDEKIMWETIKRNYKDKLDRGIITKDPAYIDQIKEEMAVFKKVNMVGFMLFMSEMMTWAKENHIATGFARGSVAGSLVAFITNITDVDPIKWHTIFSRFCNENRHDSPDIDTDWYEEDRYKIYDYIIDRFGKEKTGYVLALGTMAAKNTIATICRALCVKNHDEKYNLEIMEQIKHEYDADSDMARQKYPEVFYYFDGLVDCVVSQSQHPAGIIASPVNLYDFCGAFLGSEGQQILPLDMDCCHDVGLIKYDILGLKTVGVIDKTCKMIGKYFPRVDEIDFNDQAVYEDMNKNPATVFQFESSFAADCFKKMQCHSVFDISLVNACIRPSGTSYRDKLLMKELNDTGSDIVNELLSDSYQYLVYQEQINLFLSKICGFSGSDSDEVRRCIDENSLILMGNGNYKPIKEICCGDIVQSYNEYNISEPQSVINVFDNGIQDVYNIKCNNGYQITATQNHKILTQDGFKTVGNLSTDDYIMTPRKINAITDGLKPNKHLGESTMFLLGLLIGDGSIITSGDIHFTNHEKILIERFKECVNNLSRTGKNDCEFYINQQNGVTVDQIYSIYIKSYRYKDMLVRLLQRYNLFGRAKEKHIPDEFMLYPAGTKLINLLAGLFNTDGGYNSQGNYIEYYSISLMLVLQIKSLLLKFGIYSYVCEKYVKEYDYISYYLIIRQKNALTKFQTTILPFMIGQKQREFSQIINDASLNENAYDYLLPPKCRNEIKQMSSIMGISFNSIQKGMKVSSVDTYKNMPNTKVQKLIQNIYCPYTYQLLFAEYIPMQVKSIEYKGQSHVYDLEVAKNHNYIANNIIVHNCIAKKKEDKIAKALPKILEGYCAKSDKPRDIAEEEAKKFLKVIEDSSSYMFGYNHSLAYSMLSYLCGYYRHYYPVEYCTAYLTCANNDEDIVNGISLAQSLGIENLNVQFGHSSWDYSYDSAGRKIYRGLSSIPYMSKPMVDAMMNEAYNEEYADFIEVIKKLTSISTKINTKQLEILIKLNFFSKYGSISYLLTALSFYKKFKNRKKCFDLVKETMETIPFESKTSVYDTIKNEFEVTNMVTVVLPALKDYYFITDIKGGQYTMYELATGGTVKYKIRKKTLDSHTPINVGDIIKVTEVKPEGKWYKDANDKWIQSKENFENVVKNFIPVLDK